jgi:hypothetical protein
MEVTDLVVSHCGPTRLDLAFSTLLGVTALVVAELNCPLAALWLHGM